MNKILLSTHKLKKLTIIWGLILYEFYLEPNGLSSSLLKFSNNINIRKVYKALSV